MRRIILVLAVAALMMVASALPALGDGVIDSNRTPSGQCGFGGGNAIESSGLDNVQEQGFVVQGTGVGGCFGPEPGVGSGGGEGALCGATPDTPLPEQCVGGGSTFPSPGA